MSRPDPPESKTQGNTNTSHIVVIPGAQQVSGDEERQLENAKQWLPDFKDQVRPSKAAENSARHSNREDGDEEILLPHFKDQVRPMAAENSAPHSNREVGDEENLLPHFKDQVRPMTEENSPPRSNRQVEEEESALSPYSAPNARVDIQRDSTNLVEADLVEPPVEAVAVADLRKRWLLIAASVVVLVIAVVLGVVLGLVLPDGGGPDGGSVSDGGGVPDGGGGNEPPTAMIWSEVGQKIAGSKPGEYFGESVAISGDGSIVAAGGSGGGTNDEGVVRVYAFDGTDWVPYGSPIEGEAEEDLSGWSVAIDSAGLVLAVGARFNDGNDLTDTDRGHVRLFRFNGTDWEHDQDLDGDDPGDTRGSSVALDGRGETVAIGSTLAYGFGLNVSGDVTVYTKPSVYVPWQQVGDDLEGEFESDNNGFAVSISEDGTIVAAGAVANGENSGHARVHHLEGDEWIQMGQDLDGDPGELSGACVSLSHNGTLLAIGGPEYSGGPDIAGGRVRVFGFDGELWSQVGSDIVATSGAWSLLGISCQMSGDGTLVAVGAPARIGE